MKLAKPHLIAAALGLLYAAAAAAPAESAVTGLTIADASSGDFTLTSLSVSRGGAAGTLTYVPGQLTGVDLTDVASVQLPLAVQSGASLPAPGTRASLLEDGRLDTGVINPFSTGAQQDDSFEVTFLKPVVNSAGDDIVVLEIGAGDGTRFWVSGDRAGHGLDVAAASFSGALLTGMPYTLFSYASGADQNVDSLAELESPAGFTFNKNDSGNVVGVGLDLSAFGIPAGASVTSMRFQTLSAGSRIDPVFIVGLPPVPIAGDANADGVVNADDYVRIDRGYARYLDGRIPADRAGWSDGDFNRDGVVDAADYLIIDAAWAASGHAPPSADFLAARAAQFGDDSVARLDAAAAGAVPEPSGISLLVMTFGLAFSTHPSRRRRRRRCRVSRRRGTPEETQ